MVAVEALNNEVLQLLKKETGIDSKVAWNNIFLLVSKSEQDNEDPKKAFLTDKGEDLFTYASALSYDYDRRGVTIGLVGFTTANEGKDCQGDAMPLFAEYHKNGGEDLAPLAKGCCSSKDKCKKLIAKIESLKGDQKWIAAQWKMLVNDGGYIHETMKAWRKLGIENPSPLGMATVFDCSLNQGCDGNFGGCQQLKKNGVQGDENASLKAYNAWRRPIAGHHDFNSPEINGINRSDMFEQLRKGKAFNLTANDADAIAKAVSWHMK